MTNFSASSLSLRGGLNLAAADTDMTPGECRQLLNYEINTLGRYQRLMGYERFDGRAAPSDTRLAELPGYPFADEATAEAALLAAMAARRSAITPVPGSGPVIGLFAFNETLYAMRNTADGQAAKLYASSATGWQLVATPALLPGGKLVTRQTNFKGSAGTMEVVGTDGKNPAFRFDGSTFTQITTGVVPNAPIKLEILPSQVLLLAFRGGSFLFSGVGEPTKFSPVDGGGEIAVADEITEMHLQADNTCAIGCTNRIYILYGSSKEDFQLKSLTGKIGMRPFSAHSLADTIFMSDRGLTMLARVQQFGDFDQATFSQKLQPLLSQYQGRDVCALTVKSKNQYRLFFNDGASLWVTILLDGQAHFSRADYGRAMSCVASVELNEGTEALFSGGVDGYVYQLDRGFSFDGEAYTAILQTGFLSFGVPEVRKKWHKLVIECDSIGKPAFTAQIDYDYSAPDFPSAVVMSGGGTRWDEAMWDQSLWDESSTNWIDMYIGGLSRNISVHLVSEGANLVPHVLSNLHFHSKVVSRRR